jgi:hypothetical protein
VPRNFFITTPIDGNPSDHLILRRREAPSRRMGNKRGARPPFETRPCGALLRVRLLVF